MQNVSRPFYFGSYLVATLLAAPLTIGPLIAGEGTIKEEHLPFVVLGALINLYAFVVLAMLTYKMWETIPAFLARTTPGKSVGFLLIPIFNLYWWFPALWGWSQDWNSFTANSEGGMRRSSEWLALSIAVFSAIGGSIGLIAGFASAPWLGSLLAAPNYVLVPIFIFQVCNLLNNAPAATDRKGVESASTSEDTATGSLGVPSLVLGIESILLPGVGALCGVAAIVLAQKQLKKSRKPLAKAGQITGIIGAVFWGVIVITLILALSVRRGY